MNRVPDAAVGLPSTITQGNIGFRSVDWGPGLFKFRDMTRRYRKLRIRIRPVVGVGYLGTDRDRLAQGLERIDRKFLFLCFRISYVGIF